MFWFRLAKQLGMSVREAQMRIDSAEFVEWLAYDRLDPIGDLRGDLQAAIISTTVFNMLRGPKTRAAKPDMFLPKFGASAVKQSWREIKAVFKQAAAAAVAHAKSAGKRG